MAEKTVYIIDIDDKAKGKLKGLQVEAKRTDQSMASMGSTLKGLAGGAVVGALIGVGKAIYDITSAAEQTRISFEVMLGDSGKANKMIEEIRAFAIATPFETADLEKAANMMLGYGIASEKIMPNIKMLGDVSMGNVDKFDRLTYAFSQVQATGRLMGQDLMQLINAGFNPLKTISDKTGISMAVLKKQMSEGAISADMVSEAFKIETSEGGRFFNMMDKQSMTMSGRMSTLVDKVKMLGLGMGQSAQGGMKQFLEVMIEIVDRISVTSFEPLKEGFASIGISISALIEPFEKIFSNFSDSKILTLENFFKVLGTGFLLISLPIRAVADTITAIYETIASIINLDWNRLTQIGDKMSTGKAVGELKDVWTNTAMKDRGFKRTNAGESLFDSGTSAIDNFKASGGKPPKTSKQSAGGISLNESRNGATNINITIGTFQENNFKEPNKNAITDEVRNILNDMALGLNTILQDAQIIAGA